LSDKGEDNKESFKDSLTDFSEFKSFLLQVDQAIGISQLLLMDTLGNFTLSKRSEILEKSSVNESLKDSLLSSPLSSWPIVSCEKNWAWKQKR
jgi:hypothetical protein